MIALITGFGVIGLVETVGADPEGSQRLRGLGDRVFMVEVEVITNLVPGLYPYPVGTTFPNCYVFSAEVDEEGNNVWYETAFPTTGTWTQNSNGAATSYLVDAGLLTQLGQVSPAEGKGVLQVVASSFVFYPEPILLEWLSVGHEVFGSDIDDCPTEGIFTFPATA